MAAGKDDLLAQTMALQLALANAVCGLLGEEELSADDRRLLRDPVARVGRSVLSTVEAHTSDKNREAFAAMTVNLEHLASAIADLDKE